MRDLADHVDHFIRRVNDAEGRTTPAPAPPAPPGNPLNPNVGWFTVAIVAAGIVAFATRRFGLW